MTGAVSLVLLPQVQRRLGVSVLVAVSMSVAAVPFVLYASIGHFGSDLLMAALLIAFTVDLLAPDQNAA